MAEVSDITIKRTQDSLGKLIKKPALTDKLLRKPPFKFLHDIITAVITNTGLFEGLYTNDELQSENIKDRDAKIAFLQKAIDALKIATKQDVRARPSKIVAGLEAEKTNEFLIAIARAIDRKVDTTEAVAQVKSGNVSSPQKKDPKSTAAAGTGAKTAAKAESRAKGGKDAKVKGSDTKSSKKVDGNKKVAATKQSSKDSNDPKKSRSRTLSQGKEQKNRSPKTSPKIDEPEIKEKLIEAQPNVVNDIQNTNGNATNNFIDDQETKPNIQDDQLNGVIEQTNELPKENSSTTPAMTTAQDQKMDANGDEIPERAEKSAKSARSTDGKSEAKKVAGTANEADELEIRKTPKSTNELTESKTKSQEVTGSTDALSSNNNVQEKASNDKPRSSKSRKSNSKRDANENGAPITAKPEVKSSVSVDQTADRSSLLAESSTKSVDAAASRPASKTRPALRSAAVRPISARPSAPRRRDRNVRQILHTESFIQEPNSQQNNKSNKKNTIPEFDDADNIVITETIQDNISLLDENVTSNGITTDIDGKQGHLVQQILETQTAILKADASKNDPSAMNDDSILSDRKSFTRNTTELRKMVQKLSLYITPLGKMMEYFQEDVDAMQIELLMWQKAGAAAQADIKEEQRTTEKLLENFKYHLAEINNSIKDHIEQINNTTTNIIQNEEKISKLIASL